MLIALNSPDGHNRGNVPRWPIPHVRRVQAFLGQVGNDLLALPGAPVVIRLFVWIVAHASTVYPKRNLSNVGTTDFGASAVVRRFEALNV